MILKSEIVVELVTRLTFLVLADSEWRVLKGCSGDGGHLNVMYSGDLRGLLT
jgi:hypothetical protein